MHSLLLYTHIIYILILISIFINSCVSIEEAPSIEVVPEEIPVIEEQPPIQEDRTIESERSIDTETIEIPIQELPSVILSLETDVAGNPIDIRGVYEGLFSELSRAGFNLISANVALEEFVPFNLNALYEIIRNEYSADQIIIGRASIDRVDEELGFTIRVVGLLQVYNLIENRYTIEYEAETSAHGGDSARVISHAFSSLGQNFGKYLANRL